MKKRILIGVLCAGLTGLLYAMHRLDVLGIAKRLHGQ